jgi:hypothetical protein
MTTPLEAACAQYDRELFQSIINKLKTSSLEARNKATGFKETT